MLCLTLDIINLLRISTSSFLKLAFHFKGKGFIPDIGDINECIAFPNVCTNGRCKNTQGGFVCRCNQVIINIKNKIENMKQNNSLISIFLGLRFRRIWREMCKYR